MEGREKNFLGTPSSQRQNIDRQNSPAENTKNEIHDEKGSENNHGNEISKLPCVAHGILNLKAKHCKNNNTVVGRDTQIKTLFPWQFIFSTYVKGSRSRNKIVEPYSSQKTNERFCFSILTTWTYLNFNFDFRFQVRPGRQDRKTNSFVCFLGEVTARQFCFKIY